MESLIPPFDAYAVFVEPWTRDLGLTLPIVLMGFFVTAACGLIGNYLILRRLALVGDAISHSVLPGLVVAFLFSGSLQIGAMFVGAVVAGVLTTLLIELIHTRSRVKTDAAIGITFCSLFAIGVIMINAFAGQVHLDTECVLYGEIGYVPLEETVSLFGGRLNLGPAPVVTMGVVFALVAVLVLLFYKELLVSSFDTTLAASLGFAPRVIHYCLMSLLSVVVVAAFESVGAILVIATLILPGATAQMISTRLPIIMGLSLAHAALSSLGGYHLARWLDCSTAGAMVVAGAALFTAAWVLSPRSTILRKWKTRLGFFAGEEDPQEKAAAAPAAAGD